MTDSAIPGSLPRRWYTEEIFEAFLRSWNGMHVGTAPDRIRTALDAIAPMMEKILAEQRERIAQAIEARCIDQGWPNDEISTNGRVAAEVARTGGLEFVE